MTGPKIIGAIPSRRSFLTGLGAALITAPAICRSVNLMPVKQMLILPDQLGEITFPIEGYAGTSPEYIRFYTGKMERFGSWSDHKWAGKDVPLDADQRWERLRARENGRDPRLNKLYIASEWHAFKKDGIV